MPALRSIWAGIFLKIWYSYSHSRKEEESPWPVLRGILFLTHFWKIHLQYFHPGFGQEFTKVSCRKI